MKIYSDECLSPDFTDRLSELGFEAQCAQNLGFCGKSDDFHLNYAIENGYFLITRNPKDFIALGQVTSYHHGILCVHYDMQVWEYRELSIQVGNFLNKHQSQLSNSIFHFTRKGMKWVLYR